MVDAAKMKLVTIIASSELVDRLKEDLLEFGAVGYTTVGVSGRGRHGTRTRGAFDAGNIRLETLVRRALCARILEHIENHYADSAIVAFAQDVEAVPVARFR
jgi:nitrogen regulatory protein PII